MSKRKLSNVNINNTHPINKKIKIESYDANKHKINIDFIKPHDDYDKWNVIIIWECQLKPKKLTKTLDKLISKINE